MTAGAYYGSLLIGTETVERSYVNVHEPRAGNGAIAAAHLVFAGGNFTIQAGPDDGGPEALAHLLEALAARVREQHALWLERNAAPAADPAPETGDPT